MRFFAFCLALSALAATSVAVVSALQASSAEPTREEPKNPPLPDQATLSRLTSERAVYPLRFSLN